MKMLQNDSFEVMSLFAMRRNEVMKAIEIA